MEGWLSQESSALEPWRAERLPVTRDIVRASFGPGLVLGLMCKDELLEKRQSFESQLEALCFGLCWPAGGQGVAFLYFPLNLQLGLNEAQLKEMKFQIYEIHSFFFFVGRMFSVS